MFLPQPKCLVQLVFQEDCPPTTKPRILPKRYYLTSFTGNTEGSKELMALWARPKPTLFSTDSRSVHGIRHTVPVEGLASVWSSSPLLSVGNRDFFSDPKRTGLTTIAV